MSVRQFSITLKWHYTNIFKVLIYTKTMNKTFAYLGVAIFSLFLLLSTASAVYIKNLDIDTLTPGNEGIIQATIENDGANDIEDVSMSINLANLPLSSVGSTQDSVNEISEDDKETLGFRIKAAPSAKPGDYQIPYLITYTENDEPKSQTGTFGISIVAQPELTFTLSQENSVIGQQGRVTLKVVNKGLADAKFVSVRVNPSGYALLSENQQYLGTISSDDFETATFDVIYNRIDANFNAVIEYTDFNNQKQTKPVSLPINVYTPQKALQLGIIQPNYTIYYILAGVVVIILIFVWRSIRKRRRLKRSREEAANGR